MYHMRKASVRDLRYEFKKIERLLLQGEEIQITKRRRVIARLVPESTRVAREMPDSWAACAPFSATSAGVSGADLISPIGIAIEDLRGNPVSGVFVQPG